MTYGYLLDDKTIDITSIAGPESKNKIPKILDLPLEGWPADCFVGGRLSEDGTHHEVMVRNACGLPAAQQIWKFYPPVPATSKAVIQKVNALTRVQPFLGDEDLQEDLRNLQHFVTDTWMIEDHFQNHEERRAFYTKYPSIWKYCGRISKLRGNKMSDLGNIVHLIKRDLGIQLATPLDNLNVQLTGYDTLDFSGKTFFVRGIDADILEYLTALQEHITPHQVTQP